MSSQATQELLQRLLKMKQEVDIKRTAKAPGGSAPSSRTPRQKFAKTKQFDEQDTAAVSPVSAYVRELFFIAYVRIDSVSVRCV